MFKVGDKVKCTNYKVPFFSDIAGHDGKVATVIESMPDKVHVRWEDGGTSVFSKFNDNLHVLVLADSKPEASVKYIVKYDLVDRDPIETFTDEKSLMAWLKEVPNNKNIVKESIVIYPVLEPLKPEFTVGIRLLGLNKVTVKKVKRGTGNQKKHLRNFFKS
jgi:hypothetical protein